MVLNIHGICDARIKYILQKRKKNNQPVFNSSSNVEPVNTLKLKFGSLAIVKDNWETDLNLRHQGISLNNSALAKKEQEK